MTSQEGPTGSDNPNVASPPVADVVSLDSYKLMTFVEMWNNRPEGTREVILDHAREHRPVMASLIEDAEQRYDNGQCVADQMLLVYAIDNL